MCPCVSSVGGRHTWCDTRYYMYVCRHDCAALLADSESSIRQSGHLLNVKVEQLRGTLCLDGKDPASFSEAVHMMHVCPGALRVYSTRVRHTVLYSNAGCSCPIVL
jgi:hypothetical protein